MCVFGQKQPRKNSEKRQKICVCWWLGKKKTRTHVKTMKERCYIGEPNGEDSVCVPEKVSMKDNILCAVIFFHAYLRTKDTMHKILDF